MRHCWAGWLLDGDDTIRPMSKCLYLVDFPVYSRTSRPRPSGGKSVCADSFQAALKKAKKHATTIHALDWVRVLVLEKSGGYRDVAQVGREGWQFVGKKGQWTR